MARRPKPAPKTAEQIAAEQAELARREARWQRMEEIAKQPRGDLIAAEFAKKREATKKQLDKWAAEFAKNPVYALEWSKQTFADAAEDAVLRELEQIALDRANDNARFNTEAIVDSFRDAALRKARYPAESSSTPSNYIEQHKIAALLNATERFGGAIWSSAERAAHAEIREEEAAEAAARFSPAAEIVSQHATAAEQIDTMTTPEA